MPITITEDEVRGALKKDESEVPNSELQFEMGVAVDLVKDELAPYSSNTDALEDTAALLAAAIYQEDGIVTQLSQGNKQLSFDSDGALGLFRKALMRDPTGKLGQLEKRSGTIDVPSVK